MRALAGRPPRRPTRRRPRSPPRRPAGPAPWAPPCPPRDSPAAGHSAALGTRRATHARGRSGAAPRRAGPQVFKIPDFQVPTHASRAETAGARQDGAAGILGIWRPGNLAICRVHPARPQSGRSMGTNDSLETVVYVRFRASAQLPAAQSSSAAVGRAAVAALAAIERVTDTGNRRRRPACSHRPTCRSAASNRPIPFRSAVS